MFFYSRNTRIKIDSGYLFDRTNVKSKPFPPAISPASLLAVPGTSMLFPQKRASL
ncbi:MAG: hypothetical protein RBT69_10620 [Spirochaetia bacterium]|nr:hypothetical protein [Spirochaetia bacterium]